MQQPYLTWPPGNWPFNGNGASLLAAAVSRKGITVSDISNTKEAVDFCQVDILSLSLSVKSMHRDSISDWITGCLCCDFWIYLCIVPLQRGPSKLSFTYLLHFLAKLVPEILLQICPDWRRRRDICSSQYSQKGKRERNIVAVTALIQCHGRAKDVVWSRRVGELGVEVKCVRFRLLHWRFCRTLNRLRQ